MRATRFINAGDLLNATVFAALTPAAWLLPERAWAPVARLCAAMHLALRGSAARVLHGHPALAAINQSPESLERGVLAGTYEEMLRTLREHRPGGWNDASIRLIGLEHLEIALAAKRGAVLWVAPCNFSELNVKKALHAAGHPITNLRSHVHPYSGTRFGRAVLNRVQTSVEDRFLACTVTLYPHNGPAALRELQSRLRENAVVSITANSAGDRPCRLPFLGGTLNLALGACALARIAKAPLLPVFAAPARSGVYDVELQPAIQREGDLAARRQDEYIAAAFASRFEAFVKRYPTVWRGWFNRYQWEPGRTVEHAAAS
jgi:lauroyl/myristoyl acyltransferase